MKDAKILKAMERLREKPTEENWEAFARVLPKSSIRHYKIRFGKGKVANKQDLRRSEAELFNGRGERVGKVPIFYSGKGKMGGATIYLKGLSILNG